MNKLLSVSGVGSKGLNTDLPQWELPAEFVTNGLNFRANNNFIMSNGGWNRLYLRKAIGDYTPLFYHIIQTVGSGLDYFLLATELKLYIWNGESLALALTLDSAVANPSLWTFDHAGGVIVINHPEVGAFYWYPITDTGTIDKLIFSEADIPDTGDPVRYWDADNKKFGKVLRSHKNFLFMLNLQEDTEFMQDGFRWSHPFNPNSIPVTWDETSQFHLAGIANLGSNTGYIIDGKSLRDSFIIYSSEATNALDQSGDDFVWRRRQISGSTGLLSKDCIVEINGVHALITDNGVVINDGSQVKNIMDQRIRKSFVANLSSENYNKSFSVLNKKNREIWFCIPTDNTPGSLCDTAYIWDYANDTWAIRDIPSKTTHAVYGSARPIETFKNWNEFTVETWLDVVTPWYYSPTPFDDSIIAVDADGYINNIDTTTILTEGEGSTLSTFIERANYPLEGQVAATTIVTIMPFITGGPVRIRMGSHKMKGSPVVWDSWKTFDPATQRKLSVRTTGTLHAWQIESIEDNSFTFSGFDIEYSQAGLR